jgi:GH18 family chitinase
MSPGMMDWSALTHVIIFSADPDPTTSPYFSLVTKPADSSSMEWGVPSPNCSPQGKWGMPAGYSYYEWMRDSADAHGVKLLLCLGGIWGTGASNMAIIAADSQMTETWALAATNYIIRKNLDGLDLDWEFPSSAQMSSFYRMSRILHKHMTTTYRTAMGRNGILTIAAPTYTNTGFFGGGMDTCYDQLNLMSYDMSGGSYAWFNAGLANDAQRYPFAGNTLTGWWNWSNHGINQVAATGVPKSKLSMGVPFYSWRFQTSGTAQVGATITGRWYGTYQEANQKLSQYGSGIYHWDDSAKAPYLTYVENGQNFYITYDDTNSVKHKVQWVKDNGGGGVMLYELVAGYLNTGSLPYTNTPARQPLLTAVKQAVGGVSPTTPPQVPTLSSPANGTDSVDINNRTYVWRTATGASGYVLQLSTTSSFVSVVFTTPTITDTFYNDTRQLGSGSNYYWRVLSVNSSSQTSGYSSVFSFVTLPEYFPTLAVPALVSPAFGATGVATNVTLRWNKVDSSSGYTINVRLADSTSGTLIYSNPNIADTFFVTQALNNSGVYYWRVRADNVVGGASSAYSGYGKFTVIAQSSEPPVTASNTKKNYPFLTSSLVNGVYKADNASRRRPYGSIPIVSSLAQIDTSNDATLMNIAVLGTDSSLWMKTASGTPIKVGGNSSGQLQGDVLISGGLTVSGTLSPNGGIINSSDYTQTGGEVTFNTGTLLKIDNSNIAISDTGLVVDWNSKYLDGWSLSRILDSADTDGGGFPSGSRIMDSLNAVTSQTVRRHTKVVDYNWNPATDSGYVRFLYNGTAQGDISGTSAGFNLNGLGTQMTLGIPGTIAYAKPNGWELTKAWGDTLDGAGVSAVVDSINRTGLTTSVTATNIAHINHATTADGLYEVSYYGHTTTASGAGSPTAKFLWAWNDGTSKTDSSATWSLNATDGTGLVQGSFRFWRDSGTPTWGISVLGAAGSPVYSIHINVRKVQQ